MKVIVFVLFFVFGISSCVKVNLLPEDAVKNSIKAGKSIYDEAKLKKQGGKKRELSKQVVLEEFSSRKEAELSCFQDLKNKLYFESVARDPVFLTESVIVVDGLSRNVIECQVVGFVWPNA